MDTQNISSPGDRGTVAIATVHPNDMATQDKTRRQNFFTPGWHQVAVPTSSISVKSASGTLTGTEHYGGDKTILFSLSPKQIQDAVFREDGTILVGPMASYSPELHGIVGEAAVLAWLDSDPEPDRELTVALSALQSQQVRPAQH